MDTGSIHTSVRHSLAILEILEIIETEKVAAIPELVDIEH
jgi:hypothetical protein